MAALAESREEVRMSGNFENAAILFSLLLIVATIALAFRVFRTRASVDPPTRFASTTMVVAAVANGVGNVVRSAGLMPDDPTYQTLQIATLFLWTAMLWVCFYRARRARKNGGGA
jgi:hypothetical protein